MRLFGSVARGDQNAESDVDLAVQLNPSANLGFALGGLQLDLSDWLRIKVDLAILGSLRPALQKRILHEGVDAF